MTRIIISLLLLATFGAFIYFGWSEASNDRVILVTRPGEEVKIPAEFVNFCTESGVKIEVSHDLKLYNVTETPVLIIFFGGEEAIRVQIREDMYVKSS